MLSLAGKMRARRGSSLTAFTVLLICVHGASAELESNYYSRVWGVEGTPEEIEAEAACLGEFQSPVNLNPNFATLEPLRTELVTQFAFPKVKNPYVSNTGHNLQMNWDAATAFDMSNKEQFPRLPAAGSGIRDVLEDPSLEPDRLLTMIPMQMHWHIPSEHSWNGMLGAAETHIVTYVAEGDATDWGCDVVWSDEDPTEEETLRHLENCLAVFGVMYQLVDEEDVATDDFFLKVEETANVYLDESGEGTDFHENPFDLSKMLPEDLSYYTYVGSLTTPPCSEGVRWDVFNEHVPMSREAYIALELHTSNTAAAAGEPIQLYRHSNRDIQAFGTKRTLFFADTGDATIPGIDGTQCPSGPPGTYGPYGYGY